MSGTTSSGARCGVFLGLLLMVGLFWLSGQLGSPLVGLPTGRLGSAEAESIAKGGSLPPASALQFRLVAGRESTAPSELLPAASGNRHYRVLKEVLMDGSSVARAGLGYSLVAGRAIMVRLTPSGRRRFGEITARHIHRQIAIVYNGKVLEAPIINEKISAGAPPILYQCSDALAHAVVDSLNRVSVPTVRAWKFSATRERVLPALTMSGPGVRGPQVRPFGEMGWLNLRSGTVMTNRSVDWRTRAGSEWLATNHLDLAASVSSLRQPLLLGFDIVVRRAHSTNGWASVSAADVVQDWTLDRAEPRHEKSFGAGLGRPDCFLFRTRLDNRGVLQILGVTGDGRGVKIRYKLVRRVR